MLKCFGNETDTFFYMLLYSFRKRIIEREMDSQPGTLVVILVVCCEAQHTRDRHRFSLRYRGHLFMCASMHLLREKFEIQRLVTSGS